MMIAVQKGTMTMSEAMEKISEMELAIDQNTFEQSFNKFQNTVKMITGLKDAGMLHGDVLALAGTMYSQYGNRSDALIKDLEN